MGTNLEIQPSHMRSLINVGRQRSTSVNFHDKKSLEEQARDEVRRSYVETLKLDHRDLLRQQRRYKNTLSKNLKANKYSSIEANQMTKVKNLRNERNDLRSQIWVAQGIVHRREDQKYLNQIKCYVKCQEHLNGTLIKLKTNVENIKREIERVRKQIYDLDHRTIPDAQCRHFVMRCRRKLQLLENYLEQNVGRECSFTAKNAQLRQQVDRELRYRAYFQKEYARIVQRLNSDKKYMMELIDYAMSQFDNCIDVYQKFEKLKKRVEIDRENRKVELQGIMRQHDSSYDQVDFFHKLNQIRTLDELPERVQNRREAIKHSYIKRIHLYSDVINKIVSYTRSTGIKEVISKIHQDEYIYYSYFNYSNEVSYHMTNLQSSCQHLLAGVSAIKNQNINRRKGQMETIWNLESIFRKNDAKLREMEAAHEESETQLNKLYADFEFIFDLVEADATPMAGLLGDNVNVNYMNVRRYLKVLEVRIYAIMATVYIIEHNDDSKGWLDYLVKRIDRNCEWPTNLEDIVLTQQCPECAAADVVNMEGEEDQQMLTPHTPQQARRRLYEKITQPEMQYRLHDLAECRMPRSRLLSNRSYS